MNKRAVLFVGHAYYNAWYLSRELRKIGWKADVINTDDDLKNQGFYHGEDLTFTYTSEDLKLRLETFLNSLFQYDTYHFSNTNGIYFLRGFYNPDRLVTAQKIIRKLGFPVMSFLRWIVRRDSKRLIYLLRIFAIIQAGKKGYYCLTRFGLIVSKYLLFPIGAIGGQYWDIFLLKYFNKKIVYSNNGCLDGVLQSSFAKWGPINTCEELCPWYGNVHICSDEGNDVWGSFRNEVADVQCTIGGNRADYNDVPEVFEMPWFYCLDKNFWHPELLIPSNYLLPFSEETVKIYHAVGNYESRSTTSSKNIKCTHIYLDLIKRYKTEGLPVEMIFFNDVPNKQVRYYQSQADIFVDMLTFGFFGAGIREAMMLGKPAICYIRPEWLETMREEIPDYVEELPVISATPETVYEVLKELILDKNKREELGKRSRKFAEKWHASDQAAKYFDKFYSLLAEGKLTREKKIEIQIYDTNPAELNFTESLDT